MASGVSMLRESSQVLLARQQLRSGERPHAGGVTRRMLVAANSLLSRPERAAVFTQLGVLEPLDYSEQSDSSMHSVDASEAASMRRLMADIMPFAPTEPTSSESHAGFSTSRSLNDEDLGQSMVDSSRSYSEDHQSLHLGSTDGDFAPPPSVAVRGAVPPRCSSAHACASRSRRFT